MDNEKLGRMAKAGYDAALECAMRGLMNSSVNYTLITHVWETQSDALRDDWRAIAKAVMAEWKL